MTHFQLKNGLTVDLLSKPGFLSQFAVVMVDFGGIDRELPLPTGALTLPAGTAHFLEHQLFNKASGDISEKFAANQAQTNAFTTSSKTAYYFSGAGQLTANLDLLATLVGQPYFQLASVQRERQIIAQEIKMYQDQPDWQLEMQLLQQLYPQSPLADDIAGDLASLATITPEILLAAHQFFYQPARMHLAVVADFADLDLSTYLADSPLWQHLGQSEQPLPRAWATPLPATKPAPKIVTTPTSVTKLGLGWHGPTTTDLSSAIGLQLDLELALTTLFGETAAQVRQWRDTGLIDDSFQFSTTVERQANYVILTSNTPRPNELAAQVKHALQLPLQLDRQQFDRVKKEMLGNLLFSEDTLAGQGLEAAELGFYQWPAAAIKDYLQARDETAVTATLTTFLKKSQREAVQLLGGDLEK